MKSLLTQFVVAVALSLAACGSSPSPSTPPVTYTISGMVINLVGTGGGLQLKDNGGDVLLVNANGSFTFPTAVASGSSYNVTVSTQPDSPAQTCAVTHGVGTATADVTDVVVDCGHKEWAWMSGPNIVGQKGTYGTLGMPAAGNIPGAREYGPTWTDAAGNFWLFGGFGLDSTGNGSGYLNDLWKYSAGQWIWMGGSNLVAAKATYGTQGTAAAGNVPGGRSLGVSWTDTSGNFWLFGGQGIDSTGFDGGALNDLWKYSSGQWTWVGGSNVGGQKGTYGTLGMAAAGNIPGARSECVSWTDASGNFWLLGGYGSDSIGAPGILGDLWKYSGGEWTWMSGPNVANQLGVYGTQGTAAAGNHPGARMFAASWTDAAGNFWLFGGNGFDSGGVSNNLNDLWKYSGGQWTWIGGSNRIGQKGTYGTLGTFAPGNIPGSRFGDIFWTDAAGNFWLFGGFGSDSVGGTDLLNDLWKYEP